MFCEVKSVMITGQYNFNVDKTDGDIQMDLAEMQCNSVVKQKFREVAAPNFALIHLRIDFQKVFNLHAKNVRCLAVLTDMSNCFSSRNEMRLLRDQEEETCICHQ
jgi:hypothetical protein